MKNKILMSALLLTLFGGLTLGTVSCGGDKPTEPEIIEPEKPGPDKPTPDVITKKLICDTSSMKTNYFVGDKFDSTGLDVRLVTIKNGVEDEGVLTADYTLSIENGAELKLGDSKITITSLEKDVTGTSFEITVSENQIYKYLEADISRMKTTYYVGETLDTTGLVISLFTETNGVLDKGVKFSDYTLSIKPDHKLEMGDTEVVVKSNVKGVLSTQFSISVKPKPILTSLYDYVSYIVETNNYTVTSKIGQDNEIVGKLNKNGVVWNSSVEAYYADNGKGYADYNGNTFVFDAKKSGIANPKFITDLGGNAMDFGLWDPRTVDNFASARISNFSIQGITESELNYLKTIKPIEGNPNKYQIDIYQSKWLFNAIGNIQLTTNPPFFLDKGQNSGRIFVELVEEGLKVTLIPPTFGGMIDSCSALISNIGETVIPGLNEFLANPEFPGSKLDLKLTEAQQLVRAGNYTVQSLDGTNVAYYTKDYAYGECLNTDPNDPKSTVFVKTTNTKELEPGYYTVTKSGENYELGKSEIGFARTTYLANFDIWNLLAKYFKKSGENMYRYTFSEELGANSQINAFAPLFLDIDIETVVFREVGLVLNYEGDSLNSITFKVVGEKGLLGQIIVKDFGKTTYAPLETFVKTLY